MDNIINSFKEDFEKVKKLGFVESHRFHNTGIGKTFEDLIGVVENNSESPDYMEFLELKSSRDYTKSMITLFTKSPNYPPGANNIIKNKFGVDKEIHTTISGSRFNTFKGLWAFKLDVNEKEQKVFIVIKNLKNDEILKDIIYYSFEDLKKKWEVKCDYIAFVNAETKNESGKEYFRFSEAILLKSLSFDKFISAIKEGIILYDVRIGEYKSGKYKGKTHDHGSGFRIHKNNLDKIFNVEKIN